MRPLPSSFLLAPSSPFAFQLRRSSMFLSLSSASIAPLYRPISLDPSLVSLSLWLGKKVLEKVREWRAESEVELSRLEGTGKEREGERKGI